ncbi:MAG: hypothetical protein HGA85_00145 [Nanoarchaeota archaeon]|nr:hypothetical protein [Nanoarchaeota archaeon]
MTVLGFRYTKMIAEKKKSITEGLKVSNNLAVVDVKEAKITGASKQKGLEFSFEFKTTYAPDIASITLAGALVLVVTETKGKEAIALWEKEKKLQSDIMKDVYNTLLARCNMQALFIARDMQLPPQIPLPKIEEAAAKPKKK